MLFKIVVPMILYAFIANLSERDEDKQDEHDEKSGGGSILLLRKDTDNGNAHGTQHVEDKESKDEAAAVARQELRSQGRGHDMQKSMAEIQQHTQTNVQAKDSNLVADAQSANDAASGDFWQWVDSWRRGKSEQSEHFNKTRGICCCIYDKIQEKLRKALAEKRRTSCKYRFRRNIEERDKCLREAPTWYAFDRSQWFSA